MRYLRTELRERCKWEEFPEELLYPVIFAEEIPLNVDLQDFISHSILLNSVETCISKQTKIIPRASLTFLLGMKDTVADESVKDDSDTRELTKYIHQDALKEIATLADNGVSAGIPFEFFVAKWMKYRWLVATSAGQKITLAYLLGITKGVLNCISADVIKNALSTIVTISPPYKQDFETLIFSSYDNALGHLGEVNEIKVSAIHPIAVRKAAEGDIFDSLIIIFQRDDMPTIRFYILH